VRTIDVFLVFAAKARAFHKYLLETGSTPDEGSSQNKISGFPIMAMLTQSFLLFPPLNLPALTFLKGFRDSN
jgi:hypothetical protein